MTFYIPVVLPLELIVDPNVLGATAQTKIAGVDITVATPRLAQGSRDGIRGLLCPAEISDIAEDPVPDEEASCWGFFFGMYGPVMQSFLLTIPDSSNGSDLERLKAVSGALREWFVVFADWIEYLTDQDLGTHNLPVERSTASLTPSYLSVDDGSLKRYPIAVNGEKEYEFLTGVNPVISRQGRVGRALNRDTFQKALHRAGHHIILPLHLLLLRDARAALARNQPRRAVIDACSALEITLEVALTNLLKSNASAHHCSRRCPP